MTKYFLATILLIQLSCSSYKQFQYITEEFEIPSQIYKSEFSQSWQAVLQIMRKYDLELQNQEAGVIKTRWIDNTLELNFADSFGGKDSVKAARFKVILNVVKGFRGTREVTKVTVFKRQMVEQDFLQGWKVVRSDGILEKTILYRISRILSIEGKLKKIEEQKAKELEDNF
ncbi:MAG: hypothetical protein HN509_18650 [Halobacteriovoraceae bacterium]|jgi:hypothetical protein|nr:hypothetical protein [Halobacteriovoraceae bacterium]MBT5092835.1 hypothetical protein [Halobacteriovoraceae bacterium]